MKKSSVFTLCLLVAFTLSIHPQGFAKDQNAATEFWKFDHDGYIESKTSIEKDYDLDNDNEEDESTHKIEANYKLSIEMGRRMEVFLETELSRRDFLESDPDRSEKGWELKINQAFFGIKDEDGSLRLRTGRQTFKDKMEWLYDADLDGFRLTHRVNDFSWELAVVENDLLDDDILFKGDLIDDGRERNKVVRNLFLTAGYSPNRDLDLLWYLIFRDEQEFEDNRPDDLYFAGFQSVGDIGSGLGHWFNVAYLEGERQRSKDVREIEAYGYDLGLTLVGDYSAKPSLTIGYAFGTGDAERNQGKDTNFRQTGLEDNYYKFNGVSKFKYLGQIVDPEITNISIATLGFGLHLSKRSSLDIVYHIYQQDKAVDRLIGTDLDLKPIGSNRELGQEVDIIYGNRSTKNIYMQAVLAVFEPGPAFDENADMAYFASFEIGYKF